MGKIHIYMFSDFLDLHQYLYLIMQVPGKFGNIKILLLGQYRRIRFNEYYGIRWPFIVQLLNMIRIITANTNNLHIYPVYPEGLQDYKNRFLPQFIVQFAQFYLSQHLLGVQGKIGI